MLSKELNNGIDKAITYARESFHKWVTVEHLLLKLLDESAVVEHLRTRGVDAVALRTELESCMSKAETIPKSEFEDIELAFKFQETIQYAVLMVLSLGRKEVFPIDIFESVFSHSDRLALNPGVRRILVADEPRKRAPKP